MKFYFTSSNSNEALVTKKKYQDKYGQNNVEDSDIIVPIGGDGFLLEMMNKYHSYNKPFYPINVLFPLPVILINHR